MFSPAPPSAPEAVTHPPVRCGGCACEIESCIGLYGDWMHTVSRAERCPVGGTARPQTVADLNRERRAS